MVPINLTCLYCLQHFFFEHLFHLYYTHFMCYNYILQNKSVSIKHPGCTGTLTFAVAQGLFPFDINNSEIDCSKMHLKSVTLVLNFEVF